MKYQANPVIVTAYKIRAVQPATAEGIPLVVGDEHSENRIVFATPEMTARMTPKVGDYWVIQADGYAYLNPKVVFERKYHWARELPELGTMDGESAEISRR